MNWLVGAKIGDRFRWRSTGEICTITGFKDIDVYFEYDDGRWGYTTLPQDVELVTVLDELAEL